MKFEVDKFLALTALLAGASAVAAGCSSTDSDKIPGGSSGTGGSSSAGTAGHSAGAGNKAGESGAAGATELQGGAAGDAQGGASEAGSSDGGAAGATVGACIADLVGAGGAADESSPCDLLGAAGAPDCGDENGNIAAQGCRTLYNSSYRPSVVAAYNACADALADSCDTAGVQSCALGLIGHGCSEATTAAACTKIEGYCPGVSNCAGILNLTTVDGQTAIVNCMDPAGEFYDPRTSGPTLDCNVNLRYCASLPVPALPTTR